MATLLLRLVGPMQSWGTTSRFDQRDTGKEPSKSGVVGLLAAALGIDRENWADLEPVAGLRMGVRHDKSGIPKYDYQTAGCADADTIIKADGAQSKDGVVSWRYYLADAAFLIGLEGEDRGLLEKIHEALRNPVWFLTLGRKSYVPSDSPWMAAGLQDKPLREALMTWPWLGEGEGPKKLLYSWETLDRTGTLRMDQVLSSFSERRFGARFVGSEWITHKPEVLHVPE